MKTSGSSSASTTPPPGRSTTVTRPAPSPRRQFTLTGPSIALDPLTHAVRADIADVRLADRVFAPHYAQAMRTVVTDATSLRRDKPAASQAVAELAPGDAFDVLELAGDDAWGIAVAPGLVGYIDRHALALAAA